VNSVRTWTPLTSSPSPDPSDVISGPAVVALAFPGRASGVWGRRLRRREMG
jgi:hypothetical protein